MRIRKTGREFLMLSVGLGSVWFGSCCLAQTADSSMKPKVLTQSASAASLRDGSHDFDWELGTWHTHLKVLLHPLTGSHEWAEYDGTSVVHKIWNGRANMVELEVDGTTHVEALNLRLYNPESHQWSLNFANSKVGTMSIPTVGEFKNGRGEFYDYEAINGRMILVRSVWSDITLDTARFEQAFSDDGGKTWETNWIASETRLKADPPTGK